MGAKWSDGPRKSEQPALSAAQLALLSDLRTVVGPQLVGLADNAEALALARDVVAWASKRLAEAEEKHDDHVLP